MSDRLRFRGGAAGVGADLDDLRATAGVLGARGAALHGLAVLAGAAAADPALVASGPLSPATAARAEACLAEAAAGLLGRAARVEGLGLVLLARAALLAAADALPLAAAAAGERVVGEVASTLAVPLAVAAGSAGALWLAADAGGGTARAVVGVLDGTVRLADLDDRLGQVAARTAGDASRTATALLRDHPVVVDVVTGGLPSFVAGVAGPLAPLVPVQPEAFLRSLLAVCAPNGLLRDGAVVATGTGAPQALELPDLQSLWTSAAQLFEAAALDRTGTTVRVVRLAGPEVVRWVVQVPGTQEWAARPHVGASDPSDLTSDVALMAAVPSGLAAGVVAAMRSAGVPPGDEVLLMGHSQGGMVAAAMAADPAVTRRYRVTTVLTAGSPIARARVPDGVCVVALEHVQDPVPRLDSRPGPDRASWTTVTRDVRAELTAPGAPPASPASAHSARLYAGTAGLLDQAAARGTAGSTAPDDVAARRVAEQLAPFLGSGTAVDVRLQRRPP